VLLNLCINARDAMPQGGVIRIETSSVTIDEEYARFHPELKAGVYVQIAVSDSGIGMSDDVQRHLLEPFFTTKEPGKGTGLGLATAYGIMKQHGGAIFVYSEQGSGSTFRLFLPVAQQPAVVVTAEPPSGPVTAAGGTETIMVAEDDGAVRQLVQRVLTRAGYRVVLATNGTEAVDAFSRQADEIALVVLDVVMPKVGGRDALRQIHERKADVPVLFCTGYSAAAPIDAASLGAASDVIIKPFRPQEFLLKVRRLLDGAKRPA